MKTLDEQWDGATYYIKAEMTVDPKDLERRIAEVLNDKQKTKELEDARKRTLAAEAEVERLRKELANAGNRGNAALKEAYQYQTEILAANEYITRGNIALSNGWEKEALAEYDKAYTQMPDNEATHLFMGNIYREVDCGLSVRHYGKYLEKNIGDVDVLILASKCPISKSYYEKAEQYYKNVVINDPNNADAYIKLAIVSGITGNGYTVIGQYIEKAMYIDPNYNDAYYKVGNIYYNLEKYLIAQLLYKKAIEIDPNNADLYRLIGSAYELDMFKDYRNSSGDMYNDRSAELATIRKYYLKAIQINPDKYAFLYIRLGLLYETVGGLGYPSDDYGKQWQRETIKRYKRITNLFFEACIKHYKKAAKSGDKEAKEWLQNNVRKGELIR
jgi:tetratricopeptide (TPR) repeat protein